MMTDPDYTAEARALLCQGCTVPPKAHHCIAHAPAVSRVAARLRELTDALDEIESLARVGNEDITEIARAAIEEERRRDR